MKEISNIKVSFSIKNIDNLYNKLENICGICNSFLKKSGNIIILKYIFSFCFFEKRDGYTHINSTGIKKESDIPSFMVFFKSKIFNVELFKFKIDNITSTFSLNSNINLNLLYKSCDNVRYNPERFPGLFLKECNITAIIFRNGKINILGCKSTNEVHEKWKKILEKISFAIIIL
jgi:hypothetical protein